MTLDYGNYGILLNMGNAGFISSTVRKKWAIVSLKGRICCLVRSKEWGNGLWRLLLGMI